MIIDAEKDYLEGKNQNSLRRQDIDKIVKAYDGYSNIEKFARIVDLKEIEENGFNLNVRQYIDSTKLEEKIDVKLVWSELQQLEKEREVIDTKVEGFLKELGY